MTATADPVDELELARGDERSPGPAIRPNRKAAGRAEFIYRDAPKLATLVR